MTGTWVSVEGVEGVGKSTLVAALAHATGGQVAPEFSGSRLGAVLEEAVVESPHFITNSEVGQSLMFLGDFFEVYDSIVLPGINAGGIVISDRGLLSKYVYQVAVMTRAVGETDARLLVDSALSLIGPPQLTVYVSCPLDVLMARLTRRDGECSESRLEFIRRCADLFEVELSDSNLVGSLVRLEGEGDLDENVGAVMAALHNV